MWFSSDAWESNVEASAFPMTQSADGKHVRPFRRQSRNVTHQRRNNVPADVVCERGDGRVHRHERGAHSHNRNTATSSFFFKRGLAANTTEGLRVRIMIAESIPQLSSLSSDEKILLAAELWREAAGGDGDVPDPKLVAALRERLAYHREHPGDVSTWAEVRARILSRGSAPNA